MVKSVGTCSNSRRSLRKISVAVVTASLCGSPFCRAFSASASWKDTATPAVQVSSSNSNNLIDEINNILILDHININHEKGRHDWLTAFYVDFLQCALDPRKMENVEAGRKTVWCNIGAQQFHLPEGKPQAQVLDGVITLVYPDLKVVRQRYFNDDDPSVSELQSTLKGSQFDVIQDEEGLLVTDPWGTKFRLVEGKEDERDSRGCQPGDRSEGIAMRDLTVYVPEDSNLAGIGRFYEQMLGSKVKKLEQDAVQIKMGPSQSLTFVTKKNITVDAHVDLREGDQDEKGDRRPKDCPVYPSNYGVHISLYVADLPLCYRRASELGVAYVNTRFSRRAYTLEQAVDDCMFRALDIVDPEKMEEGPILRLEHEIRSVIKRDGSKYKSCPFDDIPDSCVTLAT